MRLGCLIFLFRSQTGRQLDSLAFLAILLRLSPCLTVTFLRFWSVLAAMILVWSRWTALTGSATAGSANAEARTAAPRPVTTLRRAVRVKWFGCMRAKERNLLLHLGMARRDGPLRPVRHHAAHGCAPVLGALAWRGDVGARSPPAVRVVQGRGGRQKSSRRPTRPIGRSRPVAVGSSCPRLLRRC